MGQEPGIREVRGAAKDLAVGCGPDDSFGINDLADRLGIQEYRAKRRLQSGPVQALLKNGELLRIKPGQYRWQGVPKPKPSTKERMWFVLRKRGQVNAPYLAQMADTTLEYALEILNRLKMAEIVQISTAGLRIGDHVNYRLINDPGPDLPPILANAEKCRRWREQRKEVIANLDAVYAGALDVMQKAAAARLAVCRLEEE